MFCACMMLRKTQQPCVLRKDFSELPNDTANCSPLAREVEKSHRDHPAERGHLLWLPLLSRDSRGESSNRFGDRFFDADPDLPTAQSRRNWVDYPQLFRLSGSCFGRNFSTGIASRPC